MPTTQEIINSLAVMINSHRETEGCFSTINYLLSLGFTQEELVIMGFNEADIQYAISSREK